MMRPVQTAAFVCSALLVVLGCGGSKVDQPVEQAQGAIRALIPAGWKIADVSIAKFQVGQADDTRVSTFKATLEPEQAFGLKVAEVEGTRIVREVIAAGQQVSVVGNVTARKYGDTWQAEAQLESDLPEFAHGLGAIKPTDTFAPLVLEGSPEEAELRSRQEARHRAELERNKQAALAKIEADKQLSLAREKAAAEERAQKERIAAQERAENERIAAEDRSRRERLAAQERAERERLERERVLAMMGERLKAVGNEHGLLLSLGGLDAEWGMMLSAKDTDPQRFTFAGAGVDFAEMPPKAVQFSGRVQEDGRLLMELPGRSEPLVFEKFHQAGSFSSQTPPGAELRPLSAREREGLLKHVEAVTTTLKVPGPIVTTALHKSTQVLSQFQRIAAGAVMRVDNSPGRPGQALNWLDGQLESKWQSKDSTIVIRYRQPREARGVVLVPPHPCYYAYVTGGNLIINGQTRVALPAQGRGVYTSGPPLLELRFGVPTEVYELRFEMLGASIVLSDVLLVGNATAAGATGTEARTPEPPTKDTPQDTGKAKPKRDGDDVDKVIDALKDILRR